MTEEQLLARTIAAPETGCWLWAGAKDRHGYGRFRHNHKWVSAHRESLRIFGTDLIADLVVDHICRQRSCVNPEHLRQVTNRTNLLENSVSIPALAVAKTHCKNGHELVGENLGLNKDGTRRCRACGIIRARQQKIRNADAPKGGPDDTQ